MEILAPQRKFSFANSENLWFKIYVFANDEVDLVKELDTLNSLLVEHELVEDVFVNFMSVSNIYLIVVLF